MEMMKNKHILILILLAFSILVTPAFAGQAISDKPMVIPLIAHEPTSEGYGPDNFPFFINPLTGLLAADVDLLDRRPIAIKVTNHPRYVRPQSGLSKADIVFEYYMEEGIPRFIAVFYGQDAEKVGPVRSGRLFDEHIFRMYDALFVFGNADTRVMDYFTSLERHRVNSLIVESNYDHDQVCGVDLPNRLCRDLEIESYNNLFANTAELDRYYDRVFGDYRPDLTGMMFTTRVPLSNHLGLIIRVWEFVPSTGKYMSFHETQGYS
jgi:hypothetical protein